MAVFREACTTPSERMSIWRGVDGRVERARRGPRSRPSTMLRSMSNSRCCPGSRVPSCGRVVAADQGRTGSVDQGPFVDEAGIDLGTDRDPQGQDVERRVAGVRGLHGDLQQRIFLGRDGRL